MDVSRGADQPIANLIGLRGLAGFWRWDLRSDAVEWSIGVFRVLGIDPSEPASFTYMESLIHPADRIDHSDPIRNARAGVYDYRLTRIIWPNGELHWISVRATVLYGADGEPETLLGTIVGEPRRGARLKRAEVAEAEMAALARMPGHAIWRADVTGHMSDIANWTALVGADPATAVGAGWLSAIPTTERAVMARTWESAIASGTPFEMRHHIVHADGRQKAVSTSGLPIEGNGGIISGWIGMISERPASGAIAAAGARPAPQTAPLTGAHIRAARTFLGWTAAVLAAKADVSLSTLRRIEDAPAAPEVRQGLMAAVRAALDHGGIAFWTMPDGSVGLSQPEIRDDPPVAD